MAKADKPKKADRNTTSLSINKEDMEPFNQLRAKETGRRGASVSQNEFIKFLLALYRVAADDSTIMDKAQKIAEERKEKI